MVYRGLDKDGNAGVVFERMAQVLLRCRSLAAGASRFFTLRTNLHSHSHAQHTRCACSSSPMPAARVLPLPCMLHASTNASTNGCDTSNQVISDTLPSVMNFHFPASRLTCQPSHGHTHPFTTSRFLRASRGHVTVHEHRSAGGCWHYLDYLP